MVPTPECSFTGAPQVKESEMHDMIVGSLVRPFCPSGAGLVVYTRRGELALGPSDIGIITYRNPKNGNAEILCRGQVCQTTDHNWALAK